MKKNQKYNQEEMFLAVELCKESGLSQKEYAIQEGLSLHTFKYWVKKYNVHHKAHLKNNNLP
jgi:transposase-like protein